MSSNLVKQKIMIVPKSVEKRVIDSNGQIERRLGDVLKINHPEGDFVAGIAAEVLDVDGEGAAGNIIKAKEDEDPRTVLERAKSEAQDILERAEAEAEEIRNEARAQAEAEKGQVLQQARNQGYQEGQAKAQAEGEALKQELRAREKALEEEFQRNIDVLEPQFVDTITDIYEHIFGVELGSYKEVLSYLVASTLRGQEGGHEFIIHVSRDDYPYVSVQKRQILAGAVSSNSNVDVVEDLTLGKNECMIETESGIFDCGLGTQLAELKNKLMLLAWSKEG